RAPRGGAVAGPAVQGTKSSSEAEGHDRREVVITQMMSRGRARVVALVLMGPGMLAMSACAHQNNSLDVGLKRVALDLSFKDQSKAKPPTVEQIVATQQLAPAPAQFFGSIQPAPTPPSADQPIQFTLPPPPPKCVKAPDGT